MRDATGLARFLRPHLEGISPYVAVETVEALALRYGLDPGEVSKLDANENPYGPSPKVYEALSDLRHVNHYPDPLAMELREAIARYAGASVGQVLVGAGADELIELLVRLFIEPGDSTIDMPPTFSMYRAFTLQNGGRVTEVVRDDSWAVDVPGVLDAITPRTKLIWVCSPNNPTGNLTPQEAVIPLLDTGVPVVVDEAYHEFGGQTCLPLLSRYPNLVILRTFSKLAGIAGLRVGYMLCSEELVREALKIKQPYNVTTAGQAAALASLQDLDWLEGNVSAILEERERMRLLLESQGTLLPYPSDSNFLLCEVTTHDAKTVHLELARRGVFVRYFSKPRIQNCLRVSVGRPSDTDRLIAALGALHPAGEVVTA